jgi:hypothetical protein
MLIMFRLRPSLAQSIRSRCLSRSLGTDTRLGHLLQKNPNDVVITLALRTPLCRAKKGALKDTSSDELLLGLLKGVKDKSMVDPALVEDIVIGKSDYPYPLLTPFIVILQEHVILPPLATKLEQRH